MITLKDKLSRLKYRQACKLLGPEGEKLIRAGGAYGIDIENTAKEIAYKNAMLNEIDKGFHFELGSVELIKSGNFPIQQASIVVANILSHILIKLLDLGMGDLIAPDGVLLLSGILDVMEEDLFNALEKHGLLVEKRVQMDDWIGLAVKRKG